MKHKPDMSHDLDGWKSFIIEKRAKDMAKCPKCESDIGPEGYDTEELKLPNVTCQLLSCKQCKTVLGVVQYP
ncbi:MAG: hypothetical protein ACR2IS_05505 [Nitrososphaeraceae archaeon]